MKQTRREFLKTGALSTLFLGTGLVPATRTTKVREQGEAKNVIVLVSDGMSSGTLAMADLMLRRRDGNRSNWIRLYEEGIVSRGLMDMASANRIVTDSSAASSSWGCGHRVNNGSVNIGPNGEIYKPVFSVFREGGKATGLVTTTEITHATPAGFAANVESRSMGEEIARQYLDRRVDVLMGGGNRHFDSEHRSDGTDLYEEYRNHGYDVVKTTSELQEIAGTDNRLLGVFTDGHLPYSLDHEHIAELQKTVPSLAAMTDLALRKLSHYDNGFILQVEGGRVDHAAHGNDAGGLIFDQIAFDDAVGVALAYAEGRDDTLVILTTDHGNANPAFNSAPDEHFDRIAEFTHTNSWIRRGLDAESSLSQIRERVEAATHIGISETDAGIYQKALKGNYSSVYHQMSSHSAALGQIIANHTDVGWTGNSHTADYIELASFGPGSEALNGFIRNTDLFTIMVEAAGLKQYV